jgi:hypothetical protein
MTCEPGPGPTAAGDSSGAAIGAHGDLLPSFQQRLSPLRFLHDGA